MIKIKTYPIDILSLFILTFIVSPKAFCQLEKSNIESPIEYFNKRTEALSLAKSQSWQELIPIAENLTLQYQKDGDLFYILGLSYYETGQYQNQG